LPQPANRGVAHCLRHFLQSFLSSATDPIVSPRTSRAAILPGESCPRGKHTLPASFARKNAAMRRRDLLHVDGIIEQHHDSRAERRSDRPRSFKVNGGPVPRVKQNFLPLRRAAPPAIARFPPRRPPSQSFAGALAHTAFSYTPADSTLPETQNNRYPQEFCCAQSSRTLLRRPQNNFRNVDQRSTLFTTVGLRNNPIASEKAVVRGFAAVASMEMNNAVSSPQM